ncbi:MAG: hypothetical protein ACREVO_09095 [Steroidobacteraceae bacterium]
MRLGLDRQGSRAHVSVNNDARIPAARLRDIEGRRALLLGKAKDNNASCAIGPFIGIGALMRNLADRGLLR